MTARAIGSPASSPRWQKPLRSAVSLSPASPASVSHVRSLEKLAGSMYGYPVAATRLPRRRLVLRRKRFGPRLRFRMADPVADFPNPLDPAAGIRSARNLGPL